MDPYLPTSPPDPDLVLDPIYHYRPLTRTHFNMTWVLLSMRSERGQETVEKILFLK